MQDIFAMEPSFPKPFQNDSTKVSATLIMTEGGP
jgi:hypothetical protein